METIITNKEVREKSKKGLMKSLIRENIKIIELVKGSVYQAHKKTKDGKFRRVVRFNDISLESALETAQKYYI